MGLIRIKAAMPLQGVTALLALAGLGVWPPASGRLLLVPVAHADANAVARVALAGGAALLGSGPVPGSLVVVGDRASLARGAMPWSLVILAAPPAGCGDAGAEATRS